MHYIKPFIMALLSGLQALFLQKPFGAGNPSKLQSTYIWLENG